MIALSRTITRTLSQTRTRVKTRNEGQPKDPSIRLIRKMFLNDRRTPHEIAIKLRIPRAYVLQILQQDIRTRQRTRIPRRGPRWRILIDFQQGVPVIDIARRHGLSPEQVREIIHQGAPGAQIFQGEITHDRP